MDTATAVRPRSTPDLVGHVLATLIACGVFAVSLAATSVDSWPLFLLLAPTTFLYALLPAALIGALAAVAIELVALRTPSVLLQVIVVAVVGAVGGFVMVQQVDVAVLVALAGVVGRLGVGVVRG